MKNYFTLLLLILSIGLYSQVGINTNVPTATIDINGDLRIRVISQGVLTDSILSVDDSGFVHKTKFTIYSTSYKLYSEKYYTFWGKRPSGK